MDSMKTDALRNIAISAFAAMPYVGGSLSYIMDKTIPEQISVRYTSFMEALEKDIISIKKEIDYARFETPQFYSMFVKILDEIISTHIEDKRVVYENILINTVDTSWDQSRNEFFFLITRNLSSDALNYLYLLYLEIPKMRKNREKSLVKELMDLLPPYKDYILTFTSELIRFKLITGSSLTAFGEQYCDFIFSPICPKSCEMLR